MSHKIVTNHVNPPIPLRDWDWSATFDGYEPGDAIGWGSTEEKAKAALLEIMRENGHPMTKIDDSREAECRAAFEKWITAPPFEHSIARHSPDSGWPGNYRSYDVQLAWCAWQDSTARDGHGDAVEYDCKYPDCDCGRGDAPPCRAELANAVRESSRQPIAVRLTAQALREAADFVSCGEDDDHEREVGIVWRDAFTSSDGDAMPAGFYCYDTEYPEEGLHGPLGTGIAQPIDDSRRGDAWQPIETAPKDGTEILLCAGCDIGVCYWREDGVMTGWTWGLEKRFLRPTHWMPLPIPPSKATSAAEKPEPEMVEGIRKAIEHEMDLCRQGSDLYTASKCAADRVAALYTHPAPRGADAERREPIGPIELSESEVLIYGRPNFRCGNIAKALVVGGLYAEIPAKSEHEQAITIHWLKNLFEQHGENWSSEAEAIMKVMRDQQAAISGQGG